MNQLARWGALLLFLLNSLSCVNDTSGSGAPVLGPLKVEIRETSTGYQLLRDGVPYGVKGVGLGADAEDADLMLQALKARGGNSFRTWNIGDGAFLDRAHELGLTVALCLDIARERHGFDYGDAAAVARQFEKAREQVLKHRNHPALLAWVIGNELNHDYSDARVYDAVNELSQMIHELDPNHPTTTTTANISASLARDLAERAPDLDFVSIQVYGSLVDLPAKLRKIKLNKPIMITEWGTIGHWEVPTTSWGAPIELDSSAKAEAYRRGYIEVLPTLGDQLIGDYAFLWGQKQERTPTWYGVFVDGRSTEAVDALQNYWTGQQPINQAPLVLQLTLDGRQALDDIQLRSGQQYQARASFLDPEAQALEYRWQIFAESTAQQSGGDPEEVPPEYSTALVDATSATATLRAPLVAGAYRLFVYAFDGDNAVAHANLPLLVQPKLTKEGDD